MMEDYDFIVRRPRHEVIADSGCTVTVRWIAYPGPIGASLGDVSRQGLKFIVDTELPADARITLHLAQAATRFEVTLPITVRWSRVQDDGRWAAGGVFDQELSWELMGELFLNGILSADEIRADTLTDHA